MKRSKNAPKSSPRKKKSAPAPKPAPAPVTRRAMLGKLAKTGLGVAVVGGGVGLLLTRTVKADMHEHDLGRIGQGVPMVVQVHDPMCPTCLSLQRQVRKAMRAFDESELQYAVASLDKADGRALALENGVGKITLLLFDANGTRRDVLHGVMQEDDLVRTFKKHIARKS